MIDPMAHSAPDFNAKIQRQNSFRFGSPHWLLVLAFLTVLSIFGDNLLVPRSYLNNEKLKQEIKKSQKLYQLDAGSQEEQKTEEDIGWIENYGNHIKSLSQESSLDGNYTASNVASDNYDWQDYTYDGPRYQPNSKSNRTVSLCAMMKNEEAYLDEWWLYYKALGVSALYLYENDETPSLHQWASMQNKPEQLLRGSAVYYTHWKTKTYPQLEAYQDCMKRSLSDGHTWSANFDADEFLMMYKHNHIVDFLEEHAAKGSVALHWKLFDTNDWEAYSPQPLTKRFRMSIVDKRHRLKTIERLSDVKMETIGTSVHHATLKKGRKSFDTAGNDVTNKFQDLQHQPTDVALLYHYKTKSFNEYIAKRMRGRGHTGKVDSDMVKRAKERHIDFKANVYDGRMWMKMKEYVPKYSLYDILYPE